jgi:hypothetical protein
MSKFHYSFLPYFAVGKRHLSKMSSCPTIANSKMDLLNRQGSLKPERRRMRLPLTYFWLITYQLCCRQILVLSINKLILPAQFISSKLFANKILTANTNLLRKYVHVDKKLSFFREGILRTIN